MGAGKRQQAIRAMRGQMWSPGRPSVARREDRQRFWREIAAGYSSEDAAAAASVSQAVGSRWFRDGGGMPPISLAPLSGRYLSFAEREEIAILRAQRVGVREIARRLGAEVVKLEAPWGWTFEVDEISRALQAHPARIVTLVHAETSTGASGAPFHDPTQVARAPNGDVYVSDGYVNSRVHRFSPEGKLIHSWGEPGQGPGQFKLPHAGWVDARERVWVGDRENNRIQFFNLDGAFLYEWPDYRRPADFYMDADGIMYVAELDAGVAIVSVGGPARSAEGPALQTA